MDTSRYRSFFWPSSILLSLPALLLLGAAPARAVPVDIFFDGATIAAFPETHYGVSEARALNLEASFGVPIVDDFDFLGSLVGALTLTQSLQSFSPNPPTSPVIRASSIWSANNVTGADLMGATYVLFTSSTPFVAGGSLVDYTDTNIGLSIDADLGWAIVQASSTGGDTFYYPAILLDRDAQSPLAGSLLAGQSETFGVEYLLNEALVETPAGSNNYQLPLFNVGIAFAAVPEPTTALMLSIGLGGLALWRRSR